MAAKNFHVKNGLSIGVTEVINSSGLIQSAALGSDFNEKVDDRVNALVTAGTGISTVYDDSAGTLTINGQVGDVTGVTAGNGLSGGGSSGDVSLAVDLNELSAAAVDVSADSIAIIDGGDNSSKKESIQDLATAMAGDNITASSGALGIADSVIRGKISAGGDLSYNSSTGVISFTNDAGDIEGVTAGDGLSGGGTTGTVSLALDLNELTAATVDAGADSIAIIDGSDNSSKKESISDLMTAVAGDGLESSSGVLAVRVDDSSIETSSDTLQVKSSGITNTMLAGSIANSKLTNNSITIDGSAVALGGSISTNNTQLTQEQVEDFVGGMLDGTETGISVSYDDTNGNLDFVVSGVTNDMLSGSIANSKLTNSSVTVNSNAVSLGSAITLDTDDVGEGSTNQYHTTERVQDVVGAFVSGSGSTTVTYDDAAGTMVISSTGKTTEEIQDIVGGMVSSNTESGITVTYEDSDGTLDFTVGTLNQNTTGSAATLTTPRTIHGVSFDGSANIDLTEQVQDTVGAMFSSNTETNVTATYEDGDGTIDLVVGDTTGNAATATALETARTINGVSFDGTANITTLTAGTGVGVSGTEVSIGQAVSTSSNVQFGNLVLSGDLTVNGSTVTNSSTNTTIEDGLIELGTGTTGTPANDTGFVIERGDLANAFIGFDESADKFTMGTGSFTGASTGDLTITAGTLVANLEGNVTGNVTGTTSSIANHDTDALSEGSSNLYFTNERAQDAVGGMFTGNTESGITVTYNDGDGTVDFTVGTLNQSTTGNAATATALANARTINGASFDGTANITMDTDATAEGSSNLYFTNARARGAVSVTDSGGDGSLAYNNSTGVITYTGPSAAETRAHLSAGTGVGFSGGAISIGQAVATNSNVTFNQIHTDYASNSGQVARNIYQNTSPPGGSDGQVGDLWILYS